MNKTIQVVILISLFLPYSSIASGEESKYVNEVLGIEISKVNKPMTSENQKDKCSEFWSWFIEKEERLHSKDPNSSDIIEMTAKLRGIHESLGMTLGYYEEEGVRILEITANGDRQAIPSVEALYKAAPDLQRWRVTKFKQRMGGFWGIDIHNLHISPEMINFILFTMNEEICINFYIEGLEDDEDKDVLMSGAIEIMEHLLGEYDAMTYIYGVDFFPFDEPVDHKKYPIDWLPYAFDQLKERLGK